MRATVPFSRRIFLRSLVRASIVFAMGGIILPPEKARAELFSPTTAAGPSSSFLHHYVMVIFADRCTGCGECIKSCRRVNDLSEQGQRISILRPAAGKILEQPYAASSFLPMMCNQCSDPPCVRVCPTKASAQDHESGIVSIDRRLCIGCRACMVVCPYMARYYDFTLKAVDGCDFCYQRRLRSGGRPACVEACPSGVLFHGDLLFGGDPIAELVEENKDALWLMRSEKGCRPNALYVSNAKTREG